MATVSIGTGGDFSTPALWEASLPAVLTEAEIGQLKNQEFTAADRVISFTAHTTSASNFIRLECEAGASFMDNPAVRTNALRYNAANGAALRTTNINETVRIDGANNHISFLGLQISNTGSAYQNRAFVQGTLGASSNLVVQDCILEVTATGSPVVRQAAAASGVLFANCLFMQRSGGAALGIDSGSGGTTNFVGCTIVAPSNNTSTGTGLQRNYGTVIAKDCAIFGFSADASGLDASSDYNATALSSGASGLPAGGGHNVYSVTYNSALFVQPSDSGGGQDFRLLVGAPLQNAGIANASIPQDISGFTRSDPPDIGAWEASAAGGGGGSYLPHGRIDNPFIFDDDSDLFTVDLNAWPF